MEQCSGLLNVYRNRLVSTFLVVTFTLLHSYMMHDLLTEDETQNYAWSKIM